MTRYLILMRGSAQDWKRLSPEEMQTIMERYHGFVDELKARGRFHGGSALTGEGDLLASQDGPFAESKEAMTGYLLFDAESKEEALGVAKKCPALTHGETVEL